MEMYNKFWHRFLRRPFRLRIVTDIGQGIPVVMIHGIASDSSVWSSVISMLDSKKYRLVTIDLLGFGDSPKPKYATYSIEEQAKNIAYTLKKIGVKKNITLVGHSLGALTALELTSKKLLHITTLVLCSPPIYLAEDFTRVEKKYKKTDRAKNNAYFALYSAIAKRPNLSLKTARLVLNKFPGFTLSKQTWIPFKQSLKNSINSQDSFFQLENIKSKTVVIYGRLDLFVIQKYFKICQKKNKRITVRSFGGSHNINKTYSKIIAKYITE